MSEKTDSFEVKPLAEVFDTSTRVTPTPPLSPDPPSFIDPMEDHGVSIFDGDRVTIPNKAEIDRIREAYWHNTADLVPFIQVAAVTEGDALVYESDDRVAKRQAEAARREGEIERQMEERKARRDAEAWGLDPQSLADVVAFYARTASFPKACRLADVPYSAARHRKNIDSDFSEALDWAQLYLVESLEAVAMQRAAGTNVLTMKESNDILKFVLKGNSPKYKDTAGGVMDGNVAVQVVTGVPARPGEFKEDKGHV